MIQLTGLSMRQGDFALHNVDLTIESNHYGVLMGRSGSGKTTVMEAICGLRTVESGRIVLSGVDVTRRRPGERSIGYVPQDGALFPTMTVRHQLSFGLDVRGTDARTTQHRVQELAEQLRVEHLLDRLPQGLSGGETQRVAIGRALAPGPSILCLDEPLSALDDAARSELIQLLKELRSHMAVTTLHITHHEREAETLADAVLVIEDGVVRQAT